MSTVAGPTALSNPIPTSLSHAGVPDMFTFCVISFSFQSIPSSNLFLVIFLLLSSEFSFHLLTHPSYSLSSYPPFFTHSLTHAVTHSRTHVLTHLITHGQSELFNIRLSFYLPLSPFLLPSLPPSLTPSPSFLPSLPPSLLHHSTLSHSDYLTSNQQMAATTTSKSSTSYSNTWTKIWTTSSDSVRPQEWTRLLSR